MDKNTLHITAKQFTHLSIHYPTIITHFSCTPKSANPHPKSLVGRRQQIVCSSKVSASPRRRWSVITSSRCRWPMPFSHHFSLRKVKPSFLSPEETPSLLSPLPLSLLNPFATSLLHQVCLLPIAVDLSFMGLLDLIVSNN